MDIPNVVTTGLILGAGVVLQHFLSHVADFHLNEFYSSGLVFLFTSGVKFLTELGKKTAVPAARGEVTTQQHSLLIRVLFK